MSADVNTLIGIGLTWFAIIEGLTIYLGSQIYPKSKRAKIMSKIWKKKKFGVVNVLCKGGFITQDVRDFNVDYATVREGAYFIDPEKVYITDGAPAIFYDEKDAFEAKALNVSQSERNVKLKKKKKLDLKKDLDKYNEFVKNPDLRTMLTKLLTGEKIQKIERVYLDPIEMKVVKGKKDAKRDPQMINQVFMKQKAVAENEAWNKLIKNMKMLLMIAAGAAVAAAALSLQILEKLG